MANKDDEFDPTLADEAMAEARHLRVVDGDEDRSVKAALPNAPVGNDHIIPDGWRLEPEIMGSGQQCLFKRTRDRDGVVGWRAVCSRPIVVTKWIDNQTSGLKGLRVAWCSHGKWRTLPVSREQLCEANRIVSALSGRGFPVSSDNKADMVRYLTAYEARNLDIMEVEAASEQMGWQKEGGFLCGRKQIGTHVTFVGSDEGEEQLANAVNCAGSFEDWSKSVKTIHKYPLAELALYASLASPLLEVLKVPNFAIDWAYRTSSGKTTTLRVAASVWGCPDERSPNSLIASWDSTPVWLERAASARSGIPLLVDDTKRAAKFGGVSVVPKTIYEICQGSGRGRGSVKGARATRYWHTVLLSTGESRAIDTSKDGGTAARVIEVWGSPFGGELIEIANEISQMDSGLFDNYGHAGPEFVRWIIDNQGEWGAWRAQLGTLQQEIRNKAQHICGVAVAARVSLYLATLEITCRLAHRALGLPWRAEWTVDRILPTLIEGALEADRAEQARQHALEWACSNRGRFCGPCEEAHKPNNGWIGRWDGAWIGFLKSLLVAELEHAGYDAHAVIRQWRERGWLKHDVEKSRYTTKMDGQITRLIALLAPGQQEIHGSTEDNQT